MKCISNYLLFISLVSLLLSSCGEQGKEGQQTNPESEKLNAFFEAYYNDYLDRHPMLQTKLNYKTSYDKWDDLSDDAALKEIQILKEKLKELKKFDYGKLDYMNQTSYKVFEYYAENSIKGEKYLYHSYPLNQYEGLHNELPAFLINYHLISDKKDAQSYIARVNGFGKLVDQIIQKLENRKEKGVILPKVIFPLVKTSCENLIKGQPFDNSDKKSTLYEDFTSKLDKSNMDGNTKDELNKKIADALKTDFQPAYTKLIDYWAKLEKQTGDGLGVVDLPDGKGFYEYAVQNSTTTQMTPDQIFELGELEVANSQYLIEELMKKVEFKGNLRAFFKYVQTDPQFIHPNTQPGKKEYISNSINALESMKQRASELFKDIPMARIEVKAVEAYREKSAGLTFNEPASPDGTRAGIYYVNTNDMTLLPKYYTKVLAFHEGIPGHLFQSAFIQEFTQLPGFRKHLLEIDAYDEGWGLYSELIPAQMGFYDDPYSEFGRLALELFRAARLVVDVGIHYKGWTRQQAIDYMVKNTPNPLKDTEKEIDRYIVMPGNATAYYIGLQKIMQLRNNAQKTLGEKYDIKDFHNIVLLGGAVPLQILEENVNGWVSHSKQDNDKES